MQEYISLSEKNVRLDSVKFHVEIPKLLVINLQVMPDP